MKTPKTRKAPKPSPLPTNMTRSPSSKLAGPPGLIPPSPVSSGFNPTTMSPHAFVEPAMSVASSAAESEATVIRRGKPAADIRREKQGDFIAKLQTDAEEHRKREEGRWTQNPLKAPEGVTDQEWARRCLEADEREKQLLEKNAKLEQAKKFAAIEGWLKGTDSDGSDTETQETYWLGILDAYRKKKKREDINRLHKATKGLFGNVDDQTGQDADGKDKDGTDKDVNYKASVLTEENLKRKEAFERAFDRELEKLKLL